MKFLLYIAFFLFQINTFGQSKIILLNDDCPTRAPVKYFEFIHIDSKVQEGDNVIQGQSFGTVSKYPDTLSSKFSDELELSKQAYSRGEFMKAASYLDIAYRKESSNPFVLESYARALYQLDKKREDSYRVYSQLIEQLDKKYNSVDSVVVVDLWFREAYWKLGTLHMDYGNWNGAIYEIGRFVGSIQNEKGSYIYEQAMSYLTECAYMLGNRELCIHFANRTLLYNPNNTYVKEYIDSIK